MGFEGGEDLRDWAEGAGFFVDPVFSFFGEDADCLEGADAFCDGLWVRMGFVARVGFEDLRGLRHDGVEGEQDVGEEVVHCDTILFHGAESDEDFGSAFVGFVGEVEDVLG